MVNTNSNGQRANNNQQEQKTKKAELYSLDGDQYNFEFMFNPNEIGIKREANVTENRGARTEQQGIPKVSFAHPNATTITLTDIIIDVSELENRNLLEKLQKLTQTIKFAQGKNRPPIYVLRWAEIKYLVCYVQSIDYKLTFFSPDGKPLRAKATITLKEIDPGANSNPSAQASPADREMQTRWDRNRVNEEL